MNIDDTLFYNILLHMDADTISDLCLANTTSLHVCDSLYFWENKFNHDQLPILIQPTTLNQWLSEYKKISLIKKEVDNLLTVLSLLNVKNITIPITVSTKNPKTLMMLKNVFTTQMEEMDQQLLQLGQDIKIKDNFSYLYKVHINLANFIITVGQVNLGGNFQISRSLSVTEPQLKLILVKMIYYYPHFAIRDRYNGNTSFRKHHVKQMVDANVYRGPIMNTAKKILALYNNL